MTMRKLHRRHLPAFLIGAIALVSPVMAADLSPAKDPAGIEFFEKSVRPVLSERCYTCHSASAKEVKGNLLLDSREGILRGGSSGPAILPGVPDQSKLIQAISYHNARLKMPPKHPLSEDEIAALTQWVKMGAPDPRTEEAPKPTAPAYDY